MDDYLQMRKKSVRNEDYRMRLIKFQAQVVLDQWLVHPESEDLTVFIRRLLDYVENQPGFAEFSSEVVFRLFPCEFDCTKTLEYWAKLNPMQAQVSEHIDHNNICSMLLADFFERWAIPERPETVPPEQTLKTATLLTN